MCVAVYFLETLAEELIEKKNDLIFRRLAHAPKSDQDVDNELVAGVGTYLAVTDKKRKMSNGDVSSAAL